MHNGHDIQVQTKTKMQPKAHNELVDHCINRNDFA